MNPIVLKNVKTTIIALGAIIGIYAIYKIFFAKTETQKAKEAAEKVKKNEAETVKKSQHLSYSEAQFAAFADIFYNAVKYSSLDDSGSKAEEILLKMNNSADYAALFLAYGVRQRYFFGFKDGEPQDLTATVTTEFASWRKARVNAAYKKRGIDVYF